jgi:hypothetical protein
MLLPLFAILSHPNVLLDDLPRSFDMPMSFYVLCLLSKIPRTVLDTIR